MNKYSVFEVIRMLRASSFTRLTKSFLWVLMCSLGLSVATAETAKVRDVALIADVGVPRPVNVFVAGRYFGTLAPGEGALIQYCTYARTAIQLTFEAMPPVEGNKASILVGSLQEAVPGYQVSQSPAGQLQVTALAARPVLPVVRYNKEERVVLSRYRPSACPDAPSIAAAPVVAPAPPAVVQPVPELRMSWQVSGLQFEFGRSVPATPGAIDVWAQGVVQEIGSRFLRVERVRVVGHSDFEGTEERKLRRSLERAEFIASALQRNGLVSGMTETVGAGDRNPVVSSCTGLKGTKLRSCNAPNRRIEVIVEGVGR